MTQPLTLTINIDGGARGNPGPASWAYVIQHDGEPVMEENGLLGQTTNNVAEYTALLKALARAAELKASTVHIKSDSELLVKQMNGHYKVKNANLLPLYQQATQLRRGFEKVDFTHVYREQNKEADRLCNEALDGKPLHQIPPQPPLSKGGREEQGFAKGANASFSPPLKGGAGGVRTSGDGVPLPKGGKREEAAWHSAHAAIIDIITDNDDAGPELLAEQIVSELKKRGFRPPSTK